jgi:hypothetical protein
MSASTQSLSLPAGGSVAWSEVLSDVGRGALVATRFIVTAAGCIALLTAAVILGNDDARSALKGTFPAGSVDAVTGLTEPLAPATEASPAPAAKEVAVDPRQKYVVQYLSRRYRVAEEATRLLVSTAFQIGHEQKLDPLLILSVVAIESSLNPFAESAMGAQGLMQVMTRVHAERFEPHGGEIAALDPVANMKVGSAILRDLISRGGSIERGLQLYVGAGNLPDDGGYGARVLGERARLALASTGRVDAAIAAGRAPAVSESKPATADATPTPRIGVVPVATPAEPIKDEAPQSAA